MPKHEHHDKLHGGVFKLHHGHIWNGHPGPCDSCALALAFDDFLFEQKITTGMIEVLDNFKIGKTSDQAPSFVA